MQTLYTNRTRRYLQETIRLSESPCLSTSSSLTTTQYRKRDKSSNKRHFEHRQSRARQGPSDEEPEDTKTTTFIRRSIISGNSLRKLCRRVLVITVRLVQTSKNVLRVFSPTTRRLVLLTSIKFSQTVARRFSQINTTSGAPYNETLTAKRHAFIRFSRPADTSPSRSLHLRHRINCLSTRSAPLVDHLNGTVNVISAC